MSFAPTLPQTPTLVPLFRPRPRPLLSPPRTGIKMLSLLLFISSPPPSPVSPSNALSRSSPHLSFPWISPTTHLSLPPPRGRLHLSSPTPPRSAPLTALNNPAPPLLPTTATLLHRLLRGSAALAFVLEVSSRAPSYEAVL